MTTPSRPSTESSLLLVVPDAEPVVARHRAVHDLAAQVGVPAHVTVAYPFKPVESLTAEDFSTIAALSGQVGPLDLTMSRTGWFGEDVLFLEPDAPDPVVTLSRRVESAFPEFPLYRGAFEQIRPHLTVAHATDPAVLRAVEDEVRPQLPIEHTAVELQLWAGPRLATRQPGWRHVRTFPLDGTA